MSEEEQHKKIVREGLPFKSMYSINQYNKKAVRYYESKVWLQSREIKSLKRSNEELTEKLDSIKQLLDVYYCRECDKEKEFCSC